MKSRFLQEFIKEIKYKNRNPRDLRALELLEDKSTNPVILMEPKQVLYRARIVTDLKKIRLSENYYGYDAKESFIPPLDQTRDCRANYKYIPYLYCANNSYIAIAEVRPQLGATVSVATISVNQPIILLDFTIRKCPLKMTDAKKNLFRDLSNLYSMPVSNNDNIIDYIPTQFIAEYAKNLGYDGIAFSSSVTPEYYSVDPDRFNVVVFNYEKCSPIKSNLVEITRTYIESSQIDEDFDKLNTSNYIEDVFREINELIGEVTP